MYVPGQEFGEKGKDYGGLGKAFGEHGKDFGSMGSAFGMQGRDCGKGFGSMGTHGKSFGTKGRPKHTMFAPVKLQFAAPLLTDSETLLKFPMNDCEIWFAYFWYLAAFSYKSTCHASSLHSHVELSSVHVNRRYCRTVYIRSIVQELRYP